MSKEGKCPSDSLGGGPEKELEKKLLEVGLDLRYWMPTLKNTLGVTCIQSFQYLGYKDLEKLEPKIRFPWEKQALQQLLAPYHNQEAEEAQKKDSEKIRKVQKQAGLAQTELNEAQSERRRYNESAVQRREEELRQMMGSPPPYCQAVEKPLLEHLEHERSQLTLPEGTLLGRTNLPDKELLRWASGGLALQGVFSTGHLEDLLEKREVLIDVPENFSLHGPIQRLQELKREFSSLQTESEFTKSVERLGFSISCSAKGQFWKFHMVGGIDISTSSNSSNVHNSHSEHAYICLMKFCYVPLALCQFTKDQLQLSREALKELKQIEELLSYTQDPDKLYMLKKTRYGNFFSRFGSHVNLGPLHFGGIYWWKAVSEGFSSEEREEVKHQASMHLDCYVKGGVSAFGRSFAANMSPSLFHSAASSHSQNDKQGHRVTQLSMSQTGGPPEVDSLPLWRKGLVASNQTWCVIDRGNQFLAVWDLIMSNHTRDFKNSLLVSQTLKEVYSVLTGQTPEMRFGEDHLRAEEEARSFLENLESWEVTDPEKQLKELMDFMQKLNEKTKDYTTWINVCLSDWALQNFLVGTVNACKDLSFNKTKLIKSLLTSLLDPHVYSVANFPQTPFIMKWIFEREETQQQQGNISEFADFIRILEESKHDVQRMNSDPEFSGSLERAIRKASFRVNVSLTSFLQTLRETEQSDTELLLTSIAGCAGYCVESNTFHYLLGCKEITFMLSEMPAALEKYQSLRKKSVSRAQAFLVLTALTVTAGYTEISPEEMESRLNSLKQRMEDSLTREVDIVLIKPRAGDVWETLKRDLNLLISGDYEATGGGLQMDQVLKDLEIDSVNVPTVICRVVKPVNVTEHKGVKYQEFLKLIKRLGLDKYYPKKMSRSDFHLIYKDSVDESQPCSDQELPFYFLQKLLMLDYRLRYLVCSDDAHLTSPDLTPALGPMGIDSDFSDEINDFFNISDLPVASFGTVQSRVHPMDIQMAIFHCADDFTRQYISTKLSICQFALPLLVPKPCTSEIEFLLWSHSQVKKNWQLVEKLGEEKRIRNYKDQLICQTATPIVSFIRIGNSLTSKSQILNMLLNKHKHDVFFHRHCKGSSKDVLLMDGVVEIYWYCPGGNYKDGFDNCVAFTNLHGDASEQEIQLGFLQEISSITIVLLSASDQNEKKRKIITNLLKSPKPFICLFDDKEGLADHRTQVRIGLKNRNEAELSDILTALIKRLLRVSGTSLSLRNCAEIARQHRIVVDEDTENCQTAKTTARALIDRLRKKYPTSNENISLKESLVPLQGKLWQEWCEKDKELSQLREKGKSSIEKHKSNIEARKRDIRLLQVQDAFPLNELLKSVIDILMSKLETNFKLSFLQWLSMFLNDLTADHLETLNQQDKTLGSRALPERQSKFEDISKEISPCTLGIEHILREIAQIYEALDEASPKKYEAFLTLPQIASDLMISGYPIELMDGDVSYVPLKWVAAVFDRLIEKFGDKKVFVLSVLGVQSTGKSTMLNAMFGLQFNVSAGRCTRGAYMQLIQVEEKVREELGFDFVLVVDTEGLRAPEHANKSLNHDNELATFVIGLGNLTLINIFGENPSVMQDTLQIAAQAFLRMKLVKLSPRCLFVHQNVGDIAAKYQNLEGRQQLQQTLDEMAVMAAEQEEQHSVTQFSDVIQFDVNSQVHYFAHLWEGNPPMAPPNPSYSHNIQQLKSKIIKTAKEESQGSILRMSDLQKRIGDLWNALVNENFIFSFRNTQEVMAMNKLDVMYTEWTWQLRNYLLSLQHQLANQIRNGDTKAIQRRDLEDPVTEKYTAVKQELEKYFSETQDYQILIQWKGNFENKLRILKDTLILETRTKCEELIGLKKSQSVWDQKKAMYENELLKRSRDLALSLKGKVSEKNLREKFNYVWLVWVSEVVSKTPPSRKPDIKSDLDTILLEHFKQEPNIKNKIENRFAKLRFLIDYSNHIKMKAKWCSSLSVSKPEESDKENINQTTSHIVKIVMEIIDSRVKQRVNYSRNYFYEILKAIDVEVEASNQNAKYKLTNKYKVDLSLCLCERAAKSFIDMHCSFMAANDPGTYLKRKKEDFFTSFKISYKGATSITGFSTFLCNKLIAALRNEAWKKMAISLSEKMRSDCPEFNGNKSNLEKHILIYLAEKENFDDYWQYIHFPKDFFKTYIKKQVEAYCLDSQHKKLKNYINITLDFFKNTILSAIQRSTEVTQDRDGNVSLWLDEFCKQLEAHLVLPRGDLKSIEHQEVNDIGFLKEAMSDALDPAIQALRQNTDWVCLEEFVSQIQNILLNHLGGCWEQCPFCNAICRNTIPDHDGDHIVSFHRPEAVIGMHTLGTDKFVISFCTSRVASDLFFCLTDGRCFPYKTYRKAGGNYATWNITPELSTQLYWKWFVSHFRSKLEEKYGKKFRDQGRIPDAWARITKDKVLIELKRP
ncbi:interferon-induced very large GTPase 1-like [Ornithorhynchus anatinus]|uniref:VLIG-type G domain-containing protein n=1 Tax=Ornithorhynchus anatinus TaxID=9258 RepID=A0A6I8P2M0_ORNAN|nr:interferon-induced very large GTPase 1-like [Ornithorhynchus anatinus]